MSENFPLEYWLSLYEEAGISTVPITHGAKKSPPFGWRNRESKEMWRGAKNPSNLAIRVGDNNLFLLDPDNDQMVEYVSNYLTGFGIIPFQVRTASGRIHSYLRTDFPEGYKTNGRLKVGQGDWRARNGYGIAAPSIVNGIRYEVLNDPRSIQYVQFTDLLPLIQVTPTITKSFQSITEQPDLTGESKYPDPIIPVPLIKRKIRREIYALAELLSTAIKGQQISMKYMGQQWQSRSEALFSGYMSMIIGGHSFNEAYAVMSIPGRNKNWHQSSYLNAIEMITQEGDRPVLADLYNSRFAFPGRMGRYDELVFKGLIALAWEKGQFSAYYTNRDMELLTTLGHIAVSNSVTRLSKEYGVLRDLPNGKRNSGFQIMVDSTSLQEFLIIDSKETTPSTVSFESTMKKLPSPELFRKGALAKSTPALISVIGEGPLKPKEISELSGLPLSTVYRGLKELRAYGVVEKDRNGWILSEKQLSDLEEEFGCAESARMRTEKIEAQRKSLSDRRQWYAIQQETFNWELGG